MESLHDKANVWYQEKLNMAIHTCDKTINKSNSVFNFHLSYFSLFRIAHVGLMSYLIPTSNQKFQLLCKIFLLIIVISTRNHHFLSYK